MPIRNQFFLINIMSKDILLRYYLYDVFDSGNPQLKVRHFDKWRSRYLSSMIYCPGEIKKGV